MRERQLYLDGEISAKSSVFFFENEVVITAAKFLGIGFIIKLEF